MLKSELPALDLASALSLLGDAVDRRVLASLAGTGLRRGHGYVIQRLLVGPATATEIADDLGVTQQMISKTLKELLALGHVEVAADPEDRRRRPMHLTRVGRRAVAQARSTRREINQTLRDALGEKTFDQTMAALTTALDAVGLDEQVRQRTVPPPEGL